MGNWKTAKWLAFGLLMAITVAPAGLHAIDQDTRQLKIAITRDFDSLRVGDVLVVGKVHHGKCLLSALKVHVRMPLQEPRRKSLSALTDLENCRLVLTERIDHSLTTGLHERHGIDASGSVRIAEPKSQAEGLFSRIQRILSPIMAQHGGYVHNEEVTFNIPNQSTAYGTHAHLEWSDNNGEFVDAYGGMEPGDSIPGQYWSLSYGDSALYFDFGSGSHTRYGWYRSQISSAIDILDEYASGATNGGGTNDKFCDHYWEPDQNSISSQPYAVGNWTCDAY